MKKLKDTILKLIENNDKLEYAFTEISKYQKNLIKNYSNPVFDNEGKINF